MKNKGFTLIEVLIASSIFAMVSMIGATIFMNISQSERKTSLSNAIYEDARVVMEMLAREIRAGTIDYEEYYSVNVLEADYYGINRGVYGSRFYDPGYKYNSENPIPGDNPDDLGTTCFDPTKDPPTSGPCDETYTILFPLSVDKNTGKNFWNDPTATANAFCKTLPCPEFQNELYLISADGREKTILVKQKINTNDYALSMIKLEGVDSDTNGVVDIFKCETDYTCGDVGDDKFKHPIDPSPDYGDIKLPETGTAGNQFSIATADFIPISPLRSSISKIEFYISPKDDPYKAFAEKEMQYQPYVTIVLTLEPSEKEKANYPGDPPKITIQTTVSAGVKQKITTYPPTKKLDWIQTVPNP